MDIVALGKCWEEMTLHFFSLHVARHGKPREQHGLQEQPKHFLISFLHCPRFALSSGEVETAGDFRTSPPCRTITRILISEHVHDHWGTRAHLPLLPLNPDGAGRKTMHGTIIEFCERHSRPFSLYYCKSLAIVYHWWEIDRIVSLYSSLNYYILDYSDLVCPVSFSVPLDYK